MRASTIRIWAAVAALLVAAGSMGCSETPRATASGIVWRQDLRAALDEARDSGRPLFVTLRCLPCKQCSEFDEDVLEGGPRLDPLLERFVTVRLTSVRDLDLRKFPVEQWQDLDLSWWGWFLSPRGAIYGVFGGKDHVSDTTRISVAALESTLRRVLEHHESSGGAEARPLDDPPRTPGDLPGFASWARRGGGAQIARDGCMHCHQLAEVLRQPALDAGTFDKRRDLDMWPLPENVGLTLERDDGLLVSAVEPGSAAAAAGLRAGDRLATAEGRLLFGQADFRAALHRGPRGAGSFELAWTRGDERIGAELALEDGWRATELSWRKSVADGNIGATPGFAWPLEAEGALRRARGVAPGSMAVKPWFGKGGEEWPARDAGLSGDDLIVSVDGEAPDVHGRAFMTWFRLRYEPGDEVRLAVRDARGRERVVSYSVEPPRK